MVISMICWQLTLGLAGLLLAYLVIAIVCAAIYFLKEYSYARWREIVYDSRDIEILPTIAVITGLHWPVTAIRWLTKWSTEGDAEC